MAVTKRDPQSRANLNLVANLRYRWPHLCERYTNAELLSLYDDFAVSVDFGNNDEKFPEWLNPSDKANAAA